MQHFYHTLDGWFGYDDAGLFKLAVKSAPQTAHFVEIGSWKGRSAACMAVEIINSGKNIQLDCIDTWQGSEEHQAGAKAEDQDVINGTLYEAFERNLQPIAGRYRAIRQASIDAVNLYPDASLDFIFIDAAHDYYSVYEDVSAWFPKVKSGGIVSGDDYGIFSTVDQALKALLPKLGHTQLAVIGKTWHIVKK